ncbi:MAG: aspartate aminotransferase family protein [Myxococcota bacterium]|nr:aspartate aminotransferase family protein [Myxococcota bacterium]
MELGQRLPEIRGPIPGADSARWVEVLARTECPSLTERRARRAERAGAPNDPIVWAEAKGANVVDVDGNVFVDLIAGFSVAAVGHGHPEVVEAVRAQAGKLLHALGDVHPSEPKIRLLERLAALAPMDDARVILGQNGADALAAAMKTAVLHTGKPGVLAFEGGYHGLMYGPLALCGFAPPFREPFAAQLNPHVRFAPWGALDVERHFTDDVGAVVVEPALGRGGLRFPPEGFLRALREACDRRDALLVFDEIFTGLGRTGRRWAHEADGVVPDLLCAGKAMGGTLPVSACIGGIEVMRAWGDPRGAAIHTATFSGHPLACAASLASLEILERDGLAARAAEVGARWTGALREALGGLDAVKEVRGRGLMVGVELHDGARVLRLVAELLAEGWITLPAGPRAEVLQLTPPLNVDEALLDAFTRTLARRLSS